MQPRPVTVLLIEDSPVDAKLIQDALAQRHDRRFNLVWVGSLAEGLDLLARAPIDVVLVDLRLPDSEGIETLQKVRDKAPHVPLVVLTAADDEALALQALQQGAQDYLGKGYVQVYERLLERSICYAIERKQVDEARREQERQLETSRRKLEEFQELMAFKDELIAKVSHELRTPLASIKEGLSLLLDNALGATTAEQQDFLKTMAQDTDRLVELINNMLDVSKIESGYTQLERQRVHLRPLIDAAIRSYQSVIGHRTVTIEGAEIPPVFADPDKLLQVFGNLLSNAVKVTDDHGTITCRLTRLDTAVRVSVQDNGPGIAPEDLPKLFQKFSQVGTHAAQYRHGTGLGLVICKALIELHKGHIDVTSERGQGTTFHVDLPICTAAFALTESVGALRHLAMREAGQTVGLIAIQAETGMAGEDCGQRPSTVQLLADELRRRVHRRDIVLEMEPPWLAILTATTPDGLQSIVSRLREGLYEGQRLRCGAALSPAREADPMALFQDAMKSAQEQRGTSLPPSMHTI